MRHRNRQRISRQFHSVRGQLHGTPGLPFSQLLPAERVQEALDAEDVRIRQCLYTPWTTIWIFLSQTLDPVHNCLQAVMRFLAYRVAHGKPACSSETGAYCQARIRLPDAVVRRLVESTGQNVHDRQLPESWRWKGRTVKVADGTTVSMPDTPENQSEYPQQRTGKPGFPLARLVVLFSLSVGTVLATAIAACQGKQTGELSLLRLLHDYLQPGEVLLGDRLYCTYFDIALLSERQVDIVTRLHQRRAADFRCGRRLGPGDHVVTWNKPAVRPDWLDEETYQRLPATLELREVLVRVEVPGFRTDTLVVVTTLLDDQPFAAKDLADLYRARWHAELDLRSLKQTLQMDVLRCMTPDMVRKEIGMHLLAYNLIRGIMADAALKHGVLPRQLSFASTWEALLAFAPYLAMNDQSAIDHQYECLLDAVAAHRVGDRPNRSEPRVKKRRAKAYPYMQTPRAQARSRCHTKGRG